MLPDFSTEHESFIAEDGTVSPPIAFALPPELIYMPDPDGLLMTAKVFSVHGELCLLTVLFPMPHGAAMAKHRQKRLPAKPNDLIKITRRIDFVVGRGGERYGRFLCEVTPSDAPQTVTYSQAIV